jgi:hypothetical protein
MLEIALQCRAEQRRADDLVPVVLIGRAEFEPGQAPGASVSKSSTMCAPPAAVASAIGKSVRIAKISKQAATNEESQCTPLRQRERPDVRPTIVDGQNRADSRPLNTFTGPRTML